MKIRSCLISLALMAQFLISPAPSVQAAAALELYGTFQAMGVVVTLALADDPDRNAVATVEYRASGSGVWRQGLPLSRVLDTRFAGSLFWLEPGTGYDVRVTFSDPGGLLHGTSVISSASTRAEV